MRTFRNIFRPRGPKSTASMTFECGRGRMWLDERGERLRTRLTSERGDTLIEVLISAVLVALIVVGTLTGLDSTNRATALQRARSQASALAEQNEEQLRSEPVAQLSELSKTHEARLREVTENGTLYDITSTAQYISDKTATASCNSTTPSADYIQTTTKVTWPAMGISKPVVETSIVSPPADSALIAQVLGASGEPVPGMNVTSTGPSSVSATTSSNGCAILAVLPGQYTLNVNRASYVDQNGYENSNEDSFYNSSFYVVAENTAKKQFEFAPAGEMAISFENPVSKLKVSGETFLAGNTGMSSPAYKVFGEVGKSATTVLSGKKLFPFVGAYSVYAGSCPADAPSVYGQTNPALKVPAISPTAEATVPLPPVSGIIVNKGTALKPGLALEGAEGTLVDTGCKAEGITVKRSFKTSAIGTLGYPGLPYGNYELCVTATIEGKPRKLTKPVEIHSPSGAEAKTLYLGEGEEKLGCP